MMREISHIICLVCITMLAFSSVLIAQGNTLLNEIWFKIINFWIHLIKKILILAKKCRDLKEYCTLNPDCEIEIVKKNCPKYCNLCEDLEFAPRNQEGKTFYVFNCISKGYHYYIKLKLANLWMFLIVTYCQSVAISGSARAMQIQKSRMGNFNLYKMDSNGRPIYENSEKSYLYFASNAKWMVKKWLICMHKLKLLKWIRLCTFVLAIFDTICMLIGWI